VERSAYLAVLAPRGVRGALPAQAGPPRQDSRTVQSGDVFFALPGLQSHGRSFAREAIDRGAALVVSDTEVDVTPHVRVSDVRQAYGTYAAAYYGHPSRVVHVVGVTGTNGKTTTVHLLQGIWQAAGIRAASIGTLGIRVDGEHPSYAPTGYTTPLPEDVQRALASLREHGVRAVAMEVSSQGLDMGRHIGIEFAGALFTNLTPEHLDYHGTMDAYRRAKERLFRDLPRGAWAAANVEDPSGLGMLAAVPDGPCLGYGIGQGDVQARDLELGPDGSRFRLAYRGQCADVRLPLVGRYNVENALCAAAGALAMGLDLAVVAHGLTRPPAVPGRMERVSLPNGVEVLVDYAHTPDGFAKVFEAVHAIRRGRVLTVFGCGGDRDQAKRPQMGAIAARMSDHLILTTDNPRSERPADIAQDIARGVREARGSWEFIERREEAVARAIALARPGDIVLLLGKGAEGYQIIGQERIPYSDMAVVRALAAGLSA